MADPKKDPLEGIEDAINEILGDEQAEAEMTLDELAAEEPVSQDLSEELDALRNERDDFKDKFMRALADSENVRKRADRDRREAENYGGSKLARDMLPVYDNMKRAMEAIDDQLREQASGLTEGLELTMRELLNIFQKHGIRVVAPEVGDKFDPEEHEAMFEAPVPGTTKGNIIQVMAEGFMIHDRLLRPAQVGVSSNPG